MAHIGLLIVIAGTVALALAVKFENKYTLSARSKEERKQARNTIERAQDGTYWEPTILQVNKLLFYGGLSAIALGTLMQW